MRQALITGLALAALLGPASATFAQPPPVVPLPAASTTYEMETLTTGPLSPGVLKQMEPLHTLQAVESLLKENYIPFAWAHRQVSAASLPPKFVSQLDALPPHEVFVVRQGEGAVAGVILSKR